MTMPLIKKVFIVLYHIRCTSHTTLQFTKYLPGILNKLNVKESELVKERTVPTVGNVQGQKQIL